MITNKFAVVLIAGLLVWPSAPSFAGTKIGIVTGTVSCLVRRVVIPDNDNSMTASANLITGETLTTINKSGINTIDDVNSAVTNNRGCTPGSSRCAVTTLLGVVTSIIQCDPLLDSIAGSVLVGGIALTVKIGDTIILP